jgi:hypothetical protein
MVLNYIILVFIFVVGAVLMGAGIFKWKVFFDNKKAGYFSSKYGDKGPRILYVVLGILIILMGTYAYYNGFLEEKIQF